MRRTFLVIGLLLACCLGAAAQDETKTYTIGVGDTLRIDIPGLFGAPQDKAVGRDGKIDLPIAGGEILVAGLTAEQVATQVENSTAWMGKFESKVSVFRYGSHPVAAAGSYVAPGIHFLTRDSVPVYVFRSVAMASAEADGVDIRRKDGTTVSCRFEECDKQNITIRSGDSVFFTATATVAEKK